MGNFGPAALWQHSASKNSRTTPTKTPIRLVKYGKRQVHKQRLMQIAGNAQSPVNQAHQLLEEEEGNEQQQEVAKDDFEEQGSERNEVQDAKMDV